MLYYVREYIIFPVLFDYLRHKSELPELYMRREMENIGAFEDFTGKWWDRESYLWTLAQGYKR